MTTAAETPREIVHDKVYAAICLALVEGVFVPGHSVTLRGLAERLGTSPMPVRAAVARLVAEGALAITTTRRISVPEMTRPRFEEIIRARILLEGEAAERALPFIDAGRLAALRSHDDRLELAIERGDVTAYMAANHDFHSALYRAAPSPVLVPIIEGLWLQFGPFMRHVYARLGTSDLVDQHEAALDAIARKDAKALRRAIETDIADGMSIIGMTALAREPGSPL